MNLRYLFKRTLPLALPALLSWGCTGDFERLNTNPYEVNPDDLPFEALPTVMKKAIEAALPGATAKILAKRQ